MNGPNDTYHKPLSGGLLLRSMRAEDAPQLEQLQRTVFPTLSDEELLQAKHYLRHLELFPEGQFVIMDGDKVIGMTTTMRSHFDFEHYHHTFLETSAGGWLSTHEPDGDWLYGIDVGIHPAYRGRGLARELYRARHELAARLGLKGQLTVGMMSGYGELSGKMTGEAYYAELVAGKRKDPTVSAQMSVGFEPIGLIPDYLSDPVCGNYGVLIRLDIAKKI